MQSPIGPGPSTTTRLPGPTSATSTALTATARGSANAATVRGHVVGKTAAIHGRNDDLLSEGPIGVQTDDPPALAILRPVGGAGRAVAARHRGPAGDAVAWRERRHAVSHRPDRTGELVAEGDRHEGGHEAVARRPLEGVDIATTDASSGNRDGHAACARAGRCIDVDEVCPEGSRHLAQRKHFRPLSTARPHGPAACDAV